MAKAKSTTKKAVSKKAATPTKTVVKKAVAKSTAKKAAVPAKKASASTAASAKKATAKKTIAKKVAAPAPARKTAATTPKAAAPKKAAPAKKTVITKKAAAPKAKAAPKKAALPAKATVKAASKKTSVKPVAKKTATAVKPAAKAGTKKVAIVTTTKQNTIAKQAPAKAALKKPLSTPAKAKAKVEKEKALPKNEIVDAINKKSDLKKAQPGAIAVRDLDRNPKKKDDLENVEKFNPVRTSILMDENETHAGPTYRYSDEDLNEFKELILKRLEVAREYLNYYQALMARKGESGTDDTDNRFNSIEDGSGAMEREQLSLLASRQMQFIDHLEKALMRIENKTYGICRVTGKLIDKARLKAVPHATLSIEAKTNRR